MDCEKMRSFLNAYDEIIGSLESANISLEVDDIPDDERVQFIQFVCNKFIDKIS